MRHLETVTMQRLAYVMALAAALVVAAGQGVDDFRLPPNVFPLHYLLQITTSVCEENPNFSFDGLLNITIHVQKPTSIIKLNSKKLNIFYNATSLVPLNSSAVIPLISQVIDEKNEFLILEFSESLCVDCLYILHLKYAGILSKGLSGFYRSNYKDPKTNTTKWMGVTQFEPTDARAAFPCFDEPHFKSLFKISLGHSKACNALSNMPLISTQNIPGKPDWVMDEFDVTQVMSTYLVAWVISDLKCVNASTDSRMRVCAREDALQHSGFALSIGPKSLQYFEKYFDLPYALPKMDMVAIPDFNAAAMENWGLITYRETVLLADENLTTVIAKHKMADTISHELAHQWFGNLVTLKWWSDVWLNEGFATYVANLGVQNAFPSWNSRHLQGGLLLLSVFTDDGLSSSHAITSDIGHLSDISQMFDIISYQKGSLLLRMMNLFLGEKVFRQGINNYLMKFKFQNADKEDLFHELNEYAHEHGSLNHSLSLQTILESWTTQKGYPVINVRRDGDTLTLSQKRFLFSQNSTERFISQDSSCWYIPITFTTQSIGDFNTTSPDAWMTCSDRELTLPNAVKGNEWYILNILAAGIFRVNYDLQNWKQLSETLHTGLFMTIPPINRMQIVNDLLDFAWTSDVDLKLAFRVVEYLKRENEYLPWNAAFSHFQKIKNIFMRTDHYDSYKRWVRCLVKPRFEMDATTRLDDLQGLTLNQLINTWACDVDFDACLSESQIRLLQWKKINNFRHGYIKPVLFTGTVLCMAVRHGGEKEWENIWNVYIATKDAQRKNDLLIALGCSGQSSTLRRYLQMILEDNAIRKQDATTVFVSVVKNEKGFAVAKDFLITNIKKLYKFYGPRNTQFGIWMKNIADKMFTKAEFEEFTSFTNANRKYLEGSERAINQSKEIIQINMYWYKRNYQQYVSLFSNQTSQC